MIKIRYRNLRDGVCMLKKTSFDPLSKELLHKGIQGVLLLISVFLYKRGIMIINYQSVFTRDPFGIVCL